MNMARSTSFVICNQLGTIVVVVATLLSIVHRLTLVESAAVVNMQNAPNPELWNELFNRDNEEDSLPPYYGGDREMNYHHHRRQHQKPNFLAKWPGLRDLMLTSEYESNELASNEQLNLHLVERLRELGDSVGSADLIDDAHYNEADTDLDDTEQLPVPSKKLSSGAKFSAPVKDHGIKKNIHFRRQYMSPCHFKICNMGRKRNTGTNNPQY